MNIYIYTVHEQIMLIIVCCFVLNRYGHNWILFVPMPFQTTNCIIITFLSAF